MKIKFDKLPDGFEIVDGQIVEIKQSGGSTGDQKNYGLYTGPSEQGRDENIQVNYSMSAVPRDEANLEAEGGETVLTDLNNNGKFNLFDIKGPRHSSGGVPLNLPEQSFVFSDFSKMKLTKEEMKEMGVDSKKRMTPAKVSKKYGTNEYYAAMKDPFADDIQARSAEMMLEKNKEKLSKLSFIQESKKDFEEGVPVTAYPYIVSQGEDPIAFTQKVEQINRQKAEEKYIRSLPMEQQMQIMALQQYMAQVDEAQQAEDQKDVERGEIPEQLPQPQQQMMPPPPDMSNQQLAQMGYEIESDDLIMAQSGLENTFPILDREQSFEDMFAQPNALDPLAKDSQIKPVVPGAGEYQKNQNTYNLLEKTLTDINDTEMQGVIDDAYNRYLKNAKEQGITNTLEKEELIQEFLKYQKNNYNVRNLATEKDRFNENLDKAGSIGKRKNQVAKETFDKIARDNSEYETYDIDEGKLKNVQLFFQTLWQVDSEKDNPRFGVEQLGPDQTTNWEKNRNISRVDGFYGNNTLNQFMYVANPVEKPNLLENITVQFPEEKQDETIKDQPLDVNPGKFKVPYNPNDPRFWLQDLLKLNAIANRKRGKFYPWQPAVEDIDVDYVLEDPTRAIAATNEQMNLLAQGLGSFGGPQSFNSRMSNIQAKTAANIANVIAGVNNRNVNTVNKGLAQQAQFDYYIDKENRERQSQLYDDTMKVEENALTEENFDREQYAEALSNAYTNMANTYNMNTLYDNFNIDPTTGGMVYFTNPNALAPSRYASQNKLDRYKGFLYEFERDMKRAPTEAEIKYFMGIQDEKDLSNYQREALGNSPALMRGYDYLGMSKKGKEVNKLLPFFIGQVGI